MKIIIVNGAPCSGKTTFENYCLAVNPLYIRIISTIDCIKDMAKIMGWNGIKTPESRLFLSELKRISTEFNDYSYNETMKRIHQEQLRLSQYDLDDDKMIFFVDCREPSEIQKYVERNEAETVLIRRENIYTIASNAADRDVLEYQYDTVLYNNGELNDLRDIAQNFVKERGL